VPAQLWSVASVHPARYARDNYAPAGLLARDLEISLHLPAFSREMMKSAARLSSSFFERLIHGFGVPPSPIRRTRNGIWARYSRLQLRGQLRIGGGSHRVTHSRFSPFGPPKHGQRL